MVKIINDFEGIVNNFQIIKKIMNPPAIQNLLTFIYKMIDITIFLNKYKSCVHINKFCNNIN